MKIPEVLDHLPAADAARRVYGEPYQTPDGATVITVSRVRDGGALGVFVVRGDDASWVPAVDHNRIALVGVITGLAAAVIGCLAMLRRPPWPDLHGWIEVVWPSR
ncbi:hypothetical protein [Mycobacterium talmoniae]|uniref:Uncharacterized protein n=1 Tax=Mycobacterium talmoniae TaxID=1858794 RepID=A0A1S1NHJ9_9MYCO|nr:MULTISPECIES: hypothetical protein [Mycobacterium]OHV03060.1 hypothetical protein BKN37_15530 [Mycobacterium talmoniae]PQM46255.1 hypothetical protein C1Y40_03575 [Mycobacterium talmoniae]TDH48532.1 hypothetical protein E2F47_23445 [Mycobacterium eburneum]